MPQPPASVTAEEIGALIRQSADELLPVNSNNASFEEMDVDSLSLVEIAVIVSEKYSITIEDWEVAQAENLSGLALLISNRLSPEAVR